MSLFLVLLLAVVQGLTEFLPVSSSGHLVIVAALFAPEGNPEALNLLELSIVLHAGTLLSILVFYFDRLRQLFSDDRRLLPLLLAATLPAVLIGLPLKAYGAEWLASPLLAGSLLIVTGLVLLAAAWLPATEGDYRDMSWLQAIGIGLAQACAILPGLSRSGTTITAGLALRLAPRSAATFSFILAVPVLAGAAALELKDMIKRATSEPAAAAAQEILPVWQLALGAAVSFVVGLLALFVLVRLLETGRFHYFAAWCIPVGIGVVAWQIMK